MKWEAKKTPPRIEEGASARVAARTKTSSGQSIALPSGPDKYPTRYLIGWLDGKGVWAPLHAPSRGLAIEEDGRYLRSMTVYEVVRFASLLDSDLASYLLIAEEQALQDITEREIEADRKRAEEAAEDFYDRVAHDMAYGLDHPEVI